MMKHFAFCLACLFASIGTGQPQEKPNIVLFLVDDMGWMDSSVYGSKYYETPNMERLAGESMRFTDAYAVPLCSPSRATILSGQYSSRHGVTSASGHRPAAAEGASLYPAKASAASRYIYPNSKNYLDPAIPNLAKVLAEAGYQTGHFGKWHLGTAPEHRPNAQGFATTWFCVPDPGPPSYFSPYGVDTGGRPVGRNKVGNITDGPDGEYITDRLTDEALKFLEANRDKPFFLNLWQYGVHGPWGHKEKYTSEFAKKTDPRGFQKNPIMASMLKSVDESLGRVLDKLEELNLTHNTLFIFYSDNGGNTHSNRGGDPKLAKIKPGHPKYDFVQDWKKWAGDEGPTNNAPLREGKGRIYEGGQRVPLMVRWPGRIEPGSISPEIVGPIDLYPTILDAAKVEKPGNHIVDGDSLLPVLKGEGNLKRDALFTWFPHLIPAVSVRSGDWKLIFRWEPHRDYPETRELYDLSSDLGETNNLAAKHPEKVAELEKKIEKFIHDTNALAPKPNPGYRESLSTQAGSPSAGLVPKQSELTLENGILKVRKTGQNPFLGSAAVKHLTGPVTVSFRIRGKPEGKGRLQWKTTSQEQFVSDGQVVNYTLTEESHWQDVEVTLPVKGAPSIIRLYLPAGADEVEFQSIVYKGANGQTRSWTFEK